MPPKRRPPSNPPPPSTAKPARPSKLAKANHISAATEADISAAFALFVLPATASTDPSIPTTAVPRALAALGVPPASPSTQHDLLAAADPTGTGTVTYAAFVGLAALQLQSQTAEGRGRNDEVERAFALFTGGTGAPRITLAMLRRVARELKEDVDEQVLRDMIREANGEEGGDAGVSVQDFEAVMRRAGVFR